MKILMSAITCFDAEPGGLSRYFMEIARGLSAGGNEVTVLVLGEAPGAKAPAGTLRVRRVPGASLPARVINFYRALVSELRGNKYDVYNPHFALYVFGPMLAGRLKKCPVVFNFQGPWSGEAGVELSGGSGGLSLPGRIVCAMKKFVEEFVYRRCDRLIVLSREFKQILVEEYGVAPARVVVLAGGCDVNRFVPGNKGEARRALGLPRSPKIVFTVRRLVNRTGIDLLIKAMPILKRHNHNCLLVVGGDGPQKPGLENLARELGLAGAVIFTGYIPEEDLPLFYRAADVTVVPSLAFEGFGLVTVEALACGVPVVATPVGGNVEILCRLEPRLLSRSVSAESLAEKINGVLAGEDWVPDPHRCRNFAVQNYSWSKIARDVLAVFQAEANKRQSG